MNVEHKKTTLREEPQDDCFWQCLGTANEPWQNSVPVEVESVAELLHQFPQVTRQQLDSRISFKRHLCFRISQESSVKLYRIDKCCFQFVYQDY
jgi:hypothetical protein